jgi:hypothetical protein
MHVGGMGSVQQIGQGVKATLAAVSSARQSASRPRDTSGAPAVRTPSRIDPGKLDAAFGLKGKAQDSMYKATFGRTVSDAMCGGCDLAKTVKTAVDKTAWEGARSGDHGGATPHP